MTYSLITLLIITEYSDSARVWKVGGVWNTTWWAEQKKHINSETIRTNAQAHQQNEATIHQLQSDIREKDNIIEQSLLQIQQKNDVIQRREGTITQQQRVITGYRDNPSRLIERDVTGEESKEKMVIQLNQSRELAEGVTVILV